MRRVLLLAAALAIPLSGASVMALSTQAGAATTIVCTTITGNRVFHHHHQWMHWWEHRRKLTTNRWNSAGCRRDHSLGEREFDDHRRSHPHEHVCEEVSWVREGRLQQPGSRQDCCQCDRRYR